MPTSSVSNVTKPIGKLLEMMDRGKLVLPEIQRDFVWSRKAIKLLIDSFYRGLPIGHMLVWKASVAPEKKAFDHQTLKRGVSLEGFYGYLLDGQQRLTALTHLRDGDEEYPLMFYVWPEREPDGDDALYWRGKNDVENPWCIPLGEVLSDDFSLVKRLNAIKADGEFKPEHEETVLKDLSTLHGILKYEVGVTEFESNDYQLATELFIRFNSTGRKLRRSDLSIAELALHVPGLISKEIRQAQSRWKDFRFTMPFLVQCLLAVHTGRFRMKDTKQLWQGADKNEIKKSWQNAERAIAKLVEFLTGTVRWTSASLIPSFNALIPLVVVLARSNSWSTEEKRLARKWLLLASVRGYFSGSAETQLNKVLGQIELKPSMKQLWAATRRSLRPLRAIDFQTGRMSGPIMSLFLSMLRDGNAKDWKNTDSPLDGTVVGHGAPLQVHHFFPRALLNKQKELSYADVNTFANYTVISANTNLDVSTEEPATYLERLNVPKSELIKQSIPANRELWRVTRYKDFLTQRCKLLAEQSNTFLGA
jgi:hypothetical protein